MDARDGTFKPIKHAFKTKKSKVSICIAPYYEHSDIWTVLVRGSHILPVTHTRTIPALRSDVVTTLRPTNAVVTRERKLFQIVLDVVTCKIKH